MEYLRKIVHKTGNYKIRNRSVIEELKTTQTVNEKYRKQLQVYGNLMRK